MLSIRNIQKYFHKHTIDEVKLFEDFSLEIPDGQFVNIIGSNGSGKTTLLNLISGTTQADSGSIILYGTDILRLPEFKRAKSIGRVYQNPSNGTAASLTVLENLCLAANKGKRYGLQSAVSPKSKSHFQELLKPLGMGLENRMEQKAASLSGGQRQALTLFMASMVEPKLLLLDEHTAALDPRSAQTIMDLTKEIVDKKQCTVIMVSHNLRFALEYGDRILMMHEGEVILDKADEAKKSLQLDDILDQFYAISIEKGNGL